MRTTGKITVNVGESRHSPRSGMTKGLVQSVRLADGHTVLLIDKDATRKALNLAAKRAFSKGRGNSNTGIATKR